jgi:hypothetical protein
VATRSRRRLPPDRPARLRRRPVQAKPGETRSSGPGCLLVRLQGVICSQRCSQIPDRLISPSRLGVKKASLSRAFKCAREDSNLHGELSPQGPQPDPGGVDGFRGVQIVQFAQFSGPAGRIRKGGCCHGVATDRGAASTRAAVGAPAFSRATFVWSKQSQRCPPPGRFRQIARISTSRSFLPRYGPSCLPKDLRSEEEERRSRPRPSW